MFATFLRAIAAIFLKLVDSVNATLEPFKPPLWRGTVSPNQEKIASSYARAAADLNAFLHYDTVQERVWAWNQDPNDLGDNCVWQGILTAWQCVVNGPLKEKAIKGLASLIIKPSFTGPTIVLRGMCKIGEYTPPAERKDFFKVTEGGGAINPSGAPAGREDLYGPAYLCKEDASLDSLIGILYGAAYASKEGSAGAILLKAHLSDLLVSLKNNNFKMQNRDGSNTEFGDLDPKLTQFPLRLVALMLVYKLAGDQDSYLRLYNQSIPILGCTETHFLSNRGWSNDHLAFMAYDALLTIETDSKIREQYLNGLKRLYTKIKDSGNPWFSAVCARWLGAELCCNAAEDIQVCLHDFLVPKVAIERKNSTYQGTEKVLFGKELVALRPLRMFDRVPTDYFWQRGAYQLDGFVGISVPYVKFFCLDFLFLHDYAIVFTPQDPK
jgi:hypothetical protein